MDAATPRELIVVALQGIAPEVDVRALRPRRALRRQIDLDSLDWLTPADRVGEVPGVSLRGARLGPAATLDEWVRAARRALQRRAAAAAATAAAARARPAEVAGAARVGTAARPGRAASARRAVSPTAPSPPALTLRSSVHRLADGRRLRLRAIVEGDAPLLAEFVRGLSPESRYRRFMVGLRELLESKLKSLTAFDPARHLALAATAVGQRQRPWIGVAR